MTAHLLPSASGERGAGSVPHVLWPGAAGRWTRRPVRAGSWLALPSARAPRLLVPADVPGAAAMLRRHTTSRRQRWAQLALGAGQRTGLLPLLPLARWTVPGAPQGVERKVLEVVRGACRVGVLLGPPRPNAKPVLQVFDAEGRTVAFGKVGHDPVSAALVRHETAVLRRLKAGAPLGVDVPRVLWAGEWAGLHLLLMTALPSAQTGGTSWEPPLQAMRSVAESAGLSRGPLSSSPFAQRLRERVAVLGDDAPGHDAVARLMAHLDGARTVLTLGRWHGDWAPWNAGLLEGRLQVWDWERCADGVPVGLDAVHFLLQREFRLGAAPAEVAPRLVAGARAALAPWYPSGASHRPGGDEAGTDPVRLTVLAYLAEVLVRYAADSGRSPTAGVRARVSTIEGVLDLLLPPARPAHLRGGPRA